MKLKNISLLIMLFLTNITILTPQTTSAGKDLEVTFSPSFLIYQSIYSFKSSLGVEGSVKYYFDEKFISQAGVRLGFNPTLPDFFIRFLTYQQSGNWQPEIGLEFGFTNRTDFSGSKNLLKEHREAMLDDLGSFYIAGHTAPLSFEIWEDWRFSFTEIDIGTHFNNFGRTLRLQINFISVNKRI